LNVIFNHTQPHSEPQAWYKLLTDGWKPNEDQNNNAFTTDEFLRIRGADEEYHRILELEINNFLDTDIGTEAESELREQMNAHLENSPYNITSIVSDSLYDLVLAVELDARKCFRDTFGLDPELSFPVEIVQVLGADNRTVHEHVTHYIPFSATYADILESLRCGTRNWQAREWGYEQGYRVDNGEQWWYQTLKSKKKAEREQMKPFDQSIFVQVKALFWDAMKRGVLEVAQIRFWHVSSPTYLLTPS
jgi:hypothetical protein